MNMVWCSSRRFARCLMAVAWTLPAAGSAAEGAIIATFSVGDGAQSSWVQVDFSNGNGYLLEYRHDGGVTGLTALQSFDAWLPEFTLVTKDFGFGAFVAGIGILDDYEYGTGDLWPEIENYWHYWVKDSGEWMFSMVGAGDRPLFAGSFDGWVFGSSAIPQPIPSPAAGLVVACAAVVRGFQRRRR